MNDQLTIKYIPLEKAVFFDRNSKKHDIGLIASLISKYGFKDPPKWEPELNNGEGGIVEGNGRIEALARLKEQGEEPPRGIAIAGDDWAVPVLFGVDCDSEQLARAYALDHNISTMAGGEYTALDMSRMFDTEKYLAELEDLCSSDAMPVSVDGDDLDLLLEQLTNLTEESEENQQLNTEGIDDVPDVNEVESRVKLGDIWQLGRHKIACGDSTVEKNVRALLGDEKCQMCWTDPPYNVDYDPEARVSSFSQERLANPIGKIANDHMSDDEFFKFLSSAYSGINIALEEGCPIYISHADAMGHHFRNAFIAQPWKLQSCLIWKKTVLVFGRADYHWMHEPILYGWKKGIAHRYFGDRKQTTILEFATNHRDKENADTDGYVHSCQKPTSLISYCIENSSEVNNKIYDPFLGSGSTLISAQKTNRIAYGFELSEHYCEVIIQRWEKLTGKVAQKISEL